MSSGNARKRIKKRKRARAKHWDLLATKTLLLPGNPNVETRLKAINTVNNRHTRKRLTDALQRAGILPSLFHLDWESYQKGPTAWKQCPPSLIYQNMIDLEARVAAWMDAKGIIRVKY